MFTTMASKQKIILSFICIIFFYLKYSTSTLCNETNIPITGGTCTSNSSIFVNNSLTNMNQVDISVYRVTVLGGYIQQPNATLLITGNEGFLLVLGNASITGTINMTILSNPPSVIPIANATFLFTNNITIDIISNISCSKITAIPQMLTNQSLCALISVTSSCTSLVNVYVGIFFGVALIILISARLTHFILGKFDMLPESLKGIF